MAIDYTYARGRKYETTYKSLLLDNKPKVIPNVAISPITHLVQGFNFILTLNNFTYGFKEIVGFQIPRRVDYISEGGVNDHELMVEIPNDDRPTLTLKRGMMIRCNPIANNLNRVLAASVKGNLARKAALMAVNTMDPQATLEQGPAAGMIQVYDRSKRLCAMYTFVSIGMINWEVDDLNADDGGILIESVTIAHTGLTRVPLAAPNTHLGYAAAKIKSDDETDRNAKNAASKSKDSKNETINFQLPETLLVSQSEPGQQVDELTESKNKLSKEIAEKEKELKKLKEEYEKLKKSTEEALVANSKKSNEATPIRS